MGAVVRDVARESNVVCSPRFSTFEEISFTMHVPSNAYAALSPQYGASLSRPLSNMDDHRGQSARILVVSDDPADRHALIKYMSDYGFRVVCRSGLTDLNRELLRNAPDLVVLDMAPDHDRGLSLLVEVKSRLEVPVIAVDGHPSADCDHATVLERGADDCLWKPVGGRELVARIRAILRRGKPAGGTRSAGDHVAYYRFGQWQLHRRSQRLTNPQGDTVTLTKGQFALLLAFLDAPQRPLTREQLLQATRVHEDVFDRSIDVQVLRLRRKLETESGASRIIETERGIGYVFTLPVERL